MSSLYVRATPRQARVLRIVEGAVRNAAHAHRGWAFDPRLARSIAKRAAGTLVAAWPSVLAAPRGSSEGSRCDLRAGAAPVKGLVSTVHGGGRVLSGRARPLVYLHRELGTLAADAKRSGNIVRFEAIRDALRLVASVTARESGR